MKTLSKVGDIELPITEHTWPRNLVKNLECRRRDLIIRIADWTRQKDEPAYDVEVYLAGVFDWRLCETFCTKNAGRTKAEARQLAIKFAQDSIAKFLR